MVAGRKRSEALPSTGWPPASAQWQNRHCRLGSASSHPTGRKEAATRTGHSPLEAGERFPRPQQPVSCTTDSLAEKPSNCSPSETPRLELTVYCEISCKV